MKGTYLTSIFQSDGFVLDSFSNFPQKKSGFIQSGKQLRSLFFRSSQAECFLENMFLTSEYFFIGDS